MQKFLGLDAIDRILATDVDVVLLTTPPGFRAEHFEKAVKAGKHTFLEKPVAVDGPTYRRFLEAARASKEKGLGVQSGFCWRASYAERETQAKIQAGEIGEVRATFGTYLAGTPWVRPRETGWTDLEWQLRNWAYFTWLSGDVIVEQAVHTVDKMLWAFGDIAPVAAMGVGGRAQRVEPEYGQSFDHFSINYEFPNSGRGQVMCRQQAGCFNETRDEIYGSKGQVDQVSGSYNSIRDLKGETTWRYKGPKNDKYQTEHDEFFASLRTGNPVNFADAIAHSSMVAVLGRMAAYTGQRVTWEEAIASKEDLRPANELSWDMKLEVPPVAVPGRTKFF
jgi:predicted dehydrogenase